MGNRQNMMPVKTIVVRRKPGNPRQALVQIGPYVFPAALGRSGIGIHKLEGDGKTPRTSMPLLYGFQRGERVGNLSSRLPMKRIGDRMLWCDAPEDPNYNQLVKAPFAPSHEKMQRNDALYDICLVLDWNISTRARKRGSAIFFHLARPGYLPTEGCIAISRKDMMRLVRFVEKGTVVKVM